MSRTRKRRRNKPSPEPDTMTAVASPTDLKRLAFVESAAVNSVSYVTGTTAFAKACGYYTSAKEISRTLSALISCLLYTSPSPRDYAASRMPSSA